MTRFITGRGPECSDCGDHHHDGAALAWRLLADAGRESHLVVRAWASGGTSLPVVEVGIEHVYHKWLTAAEARDMARALIRAANAVAVAMPAYNAAVEAARLAAGPITHTSGSGMWVSTFEPGGPPVGWPRG